MIIEKKSYSCPKCYTPYCFEAEKDTGENYCPKCNTKLRYDSTYLFNTDTKKVVEYTHRAEPSEEAKKIIDNSQLQQKSKPTVTCPYCKSTNTVKISGLYKAASIGLFGLFAVPGATKQWTCKDCKSDF